MAQVIWSLRSENDLAEIYAFVRRDSPIAAAALVLRIIAAGRRLADFPESGHPIRGLEHRDARELIVSPYRILYRLSKETVGIITVRHAARLLREEDL